MHLINNNNPDFAAYTVDTSITSFGQADLAERLGAASFFFMTDMEGSGATGLTDATRAIVANWVGGGGVMLMTGTGGSADANFLNDIFGWDVSSTSCSTASLNTANAAGTPFAAGSATVSCPSATDHLNCGSQPCTPIYGTSDSNAVSILTFGDGKVVYVGFDYFNTGYAEYIAQGSGGMHTDCANNVDPYVTDVLPFSIQLAGQLSDPCPTRRLQGGPVVSIYAQPGMSGSGPGSCSDESANLESIMMHLINNNPDVFGDYTGDTSITSFAQADLAERLGAASFFFMTDMEGSGATGLTDASRGIVADFVGGGGVMLMTGTGGSADATFLNDIFGWDVSSVGCSTASLNTANAEGTPFALGSATVTCPSATDHLNCGSQACTPIYGTS